MSRSDVLAQNSFAVFNHCKHAVQQQMMSWKKFYNELHFGLFTLGGALQVCSVKLSRKHHIKSNVTYGIN